MRRAFGMGVLAAAAAFGLAACEKQQTMAASQKKSDTPVWQASDSRWARDFKAGDKASWDRQMALRAQYQNDYSRADQ